MLKSTIFGLQNSPIRQCKNFLGKTPNLHRKKVLLCGRGEGKEEEGMGEMNVG